MSGLEPLLLVGALASGVVGAAGAMQEGEANAQAAEENARTAAFNQQIANQDREYAGKTARIDAEDQSRENRRTLASVRAAFGTSGGEFSGSPFDVLKDTAAEGALDVSRIEQEGRARVREGALSYLGFQRDEAQEYRKAGTSRQAGALGALGAITNAGTRLIRMS